MIVLIAAASIVLAQTVHNSRTRAEQGLVGERRVNLGVHNVDREPERLSHTFRFVNTTDRLLTIKKIVTTCGCTEARASTQTIPALTNFEVEASLTVKDSGRRQEQVTLIFDSGEPLVLELTATGRKSAGVFVVDRSLNLGASEAARIVISQVGNSQTGPSDIIVKSPTGVRAICGPWELVHGGDPEREIPARWHCRVTVETTSEFNSSTGPIAIGLPSGEWAYVGLHGHPWH